MLRTLRVLTIVQPAALPRAVVLARSLAAEHPDWPLTVLVTASAVPEPTTLPAGTSVVALDTELDHAASEVLTAILEPETLAEAVRGPTLARMLDAGDAALYLDPTFLVTGSLEGIARALGDHEAILIPRPGHPVPRDPRHGPARDRGTFHSGIIALRPGATADAILADWPAADLVESSSGTDVGARRSGFSIWLDALPVRVPGVGVCTQDRLLVDPACLTEDLSSATSLVDLASLEPDRPHALALGNGVPALSEAPRLAVMVMRYADEVLAATPAGEPSTAFKRLPDGTELDARLRRLAAQAIDAGELTTSVFGPAGETAFYEWLTQPASVGAAVGLNRYHQAIWEDRVDLRTAYPHLNGPDAEGFAGWLSVHAPQELPMPAALLPPRPAHLEDGPPFASDPLWGVNVAGFFSSELGLGEAARLLIAGLDAAPVPALPVQGALVPPCRQEAEFHFASPSEAPYPINILCMNGDTIPVFAREAGPEFFHDRYTIALWWWELGEFPAEWRSAFDVVDEVWVASDLIRDAVSAASPAPVVKVPLPVELPPLQRFDRGALGLPEGFLFLFVFDYHSTAARKNPVGVIEAFRQAFEPGSGAALAIKTINAENLPHEHQRVLLAAAGHPDIHFVDRYVSAGEKNAMLAACDCYVSLHRSEGFGLTPAEAMYLGRPVIATAYGGVTEFMTADNAYLVSHRPAVVGRDAHPYPPDGQWADPDVEHAARLMRHVFEHPEEAAERGRRAARDIRRTNSPAAAGAAMASRLRCIHALLVERGHRSLVIPQVPPLDLDRARGHVAAGAHATGRNGVVRALRRATQKALGPQSRDADERLLEAVEATDRRLREISAELERHQMAAHTETLAAFRRARRESRAAQQRLDRLEAGHAALTDEATALVQHLAEHRALPYMAPDAALTTWDEPGVGVVTGYRGSGEKLPGYRAFTDAFRGSEEHVKALQRDYVELLRGHEPVLDVGCGRGELLSLLADERIAAAGVDADADMTRLCRGRGLDVVHADALEHLRSLPDHSLGAVFSAQLVEHLDAESLTALLSVARAKLRSGGRFIAETVNPHSLQALKAFWVDPTHHHPLFPETLVELCRIAGFAEAFVMHPGGSGDVDADRFERPAYAVVARR